MVGQAWMSRGEFIDPPVQARTETFVWFRPFNTAQESSIAVCPRLQKEDGRKEVKLFQYSYHVAERGKGSRGGQYRLVRAAEKGSDLFIQPLLAQQGEKPAGRVKKEWMKWNRAPGLLHDNASL
jgi:hypothetical protein